MLSKHHSWSSRKPCVVSNHGRSAPLARFGYTLPEMLIVLAILSAMAALVLPSLQGPLDKSRLRGSARQVQAALGKARALAIREGTPLVFRYEVGGRMWKLERVGRSPLTGTGNSDLDSLNSLGRPVEGRPKAISSSADDVKSELQPATVVREGRLPDGVTFAVLPPPVSKQGSEETVGDHRAIGVVDSSGTVRWSQPITFRPNGRSEDAALTINGSRDFAVDVSIRGLTSSVKYSPPFRRISSIGRLADDALDGLTTAEVVR